MSFRKSEPENSRAISLRPLWELVTNLRNDSLIKLNNYFSDYTFRRHSRLHTVFLGIRGDLETYLEKDTLMGIERTFNGYIEITKDRNNANGIEMTAGYFVKLDPDQLKELINIIEVYKSYAIQALSIKDLIEQIKLLEFPEMIYKNIKSLYADSDDVLKRTDNLKCPSLDKSPTSRRDLYVQCIEQYESRLQQVLNLARESIKEQASSLENEFEQYTSECNKINENILSFNGRMLHDFNEDRKKNARWLAEMESKLVGLYERKKNATSQEMLDEVNADIVAFKNQFDKYKQEAILFQQELIDRRAAVVQEQRAYLDKLVDFKDALVYRKSVDTSRSSFFTFSHRFNILYEESMQNEKLDRDNLKKIHDQLHKISRGMYDFIQRVNEYFKENVSSKPFCEVTSKLHVECSKIIACLYSISDIKISLNGVNFDQKTIDEINKICNMSKDDLEKERDVKSEIEYISADVQRYINRHDTVESELKRILNELRKFESDIDELNRELSHECNVLYRNAGKELENLTFDAQLTRSFQIEAKIKFKPDFIDIDSQKIEVFDQRRLISFEEKLTELQQINLKQDRRGGVYFMPNRRPSRPGFFKRHLGFILGATAITGVLGLLGGGALAAGIILAPATFGLSMIPASAACIGIGVGVGIAAALGLTLTGGVMACAACGVADKCCQSVQRQHQNEASLLGGSTAVVRSSMPAGEARIEDIADLADLAAAIEAMPDFCSDSSPAVVAEFSTGYQPRP